MVVVASVTRLTERCHGQVVVAGSHGGLIAAYLAARRGAQAVILNDAGGGLEAAGIAGLGYLEAIGTAAATVDVWSARIGDGIDTLVSGRLSHVNAVAWRLGLRPGMAAAAAVRPLGEAPLAEAPPPSVGEAATLLHAVPGHRRVWALDTASLANASHHDAILITGSHGALLDGRPETALRCDARAAVFNDACAGKDRAGLGRLAALDGRGIAAATVDARTARIGDARSSWRTGVISHVNTAARTAGARPGMTVRSFARLFLDPRTP